MEIILRDEQYDGVGLQVTDVSFIFTSKLGRKPLLTS